MAVAETAGSPEEELYVLTAVLLTPSRFPSVLGDDYPEACAALALEPYPDGYGLLLGQDGTGARWTVATDDVTLTACAIAAWDCGMEQDLSPEEHTIAAVLPGWPLELAVSASALPDPHDPEPAPGDPPPLAPPDPGQWGPPQRRLGADELAEQWSEWRAKVDQEITFSDPDESGRHPGVRAVLTALEEYTAAPPPPGRVRSRFAGDSARTLRADGPGWSMVARTDDMAFILLDDLPGEILPVGRGPGLPVLLRRLDELADHPDRL